MTIYKYMKLPFRIEGDEILRQKTTDITEKNEELDKLIFDMFDTLSDSIGCGLSAPQIGVSKSIFVIDADKMGGYYPECRGIKKTIINPQIVKTSRKTTVISEGCLSVPGVIKELKRPDMVTLKYLDENLVEHKEKFHGFVARIVLHEYDHLQGKLMTDYNNEVKYE